LLRPGPVNIGQILVLLGLNVNAPVPAEAIDPWSALTLRASSAVQTLAGLPLRIAPEDLRGAQVTMYNVNTRVTEVFFLRFDGVMPAEDEDRIKDLFRCKRTGRKRMPDRGLLQILARLGEHYPDQVFELVSAHRGRAAERTSKHYSGHAVDLRIRGVKASELRDHVWQTFSAKMNIGLGHYHRDGFIHIDHRPKEPSIGWVQTRKNSPYRYHPRWARPTS
jgi:uncharacterized protein YcbK (DUF882 family)